MRVLTLTPPPPPPPPPLECIIAHCIHCLCLKKLLPLPLSHVLIPIPPILPFPPIPIPMTTLDMSDAFDVFSPPANDLPLRATLADKDSAVQTGSIDHAEKSAGALSKAAGLTLTMDRCSHTCAASLFAPHP
jgi:hypothetical protein